MMRNVGSCFCLFPPLPLLLPPYSLYTSGPRIYTYKFSAHCPTHSAKEPPNSGTRHCADRHATMSQSSGGRATLPRQMKMHLSGRAAAEPGRMRLGKYSRICFQRTGPLQFPQVLGTRMEIQPCCTLVHWVTRQKASARVAISLSLVRGKALLKPIQLSHCPDVIRAILLVLGHRRGLHLDICLGGQQRGGVDLDSPRGRIPGLCAVDLGRDALPMKSPFKVINVLGNRLAGLVLLVVPLLVAIVISHAHRAHHLLRRGGSCRCNRHLSHFFS